jgi:predicted secreted protein
MTKADLHRLVDEIPEASVDPVAVLLERAKDPVVAALDAAPADDEPYSEAERADDKVTIESLRRGEGRPLVDVMRDLRAADRAS